jgi:hypothetical protein
MFASETLCGSFLFLSKIIGLGILLGFSATIGMFASVWILVKAFGLLVDDEDDGVIGH